MKKRISSGSVKFKTEKIKTKNGELDFQIDEGMQREIMESLSDMDKFWAGYTNSDGTMNISKLASDRLYSLYKERMQKMIYDQGYEQGGKHTALRFKNAKTRGESTPVSNETSVQKQLAQKIFNR